MNAFRSSSLVCFAIVLLTTIQSAPRAAAQVYSPDPAKWGDGKEHLVLAKVESKKAFTNNEKDEMVTFGVKVILDMNGTLADHSISVTGEASPFNYVFVAPDLTIGDYVIFHILPTKQADAFTEGFAKTPIGLDSSVKVPPDDLKEIQEAMKMAATVLPIKDAKKAHAEALKLLKEKSYYLWALGAMMLAIEGTKENVDILSGNVADDGTMTKFYWVRWLLDKQFPKDVIPSWEQREMDLMNFLKKQSKPLFR